MAFSMNLRDLTSPQYSAVTGRNKKTPYTAYLTAMGPYAREMARQDQLDTIRSNELAQSTAQFNAGQVLERERLDAEMEQAEKASTINLVNTGLTAAALANQAGIINLKDVAGGVIKGGKYLYNAAAGAGAGSGAGAAVTDAGSLAGAAAAESLAGTAAGAGASGAGMYGGSGVTYAADGTVVGGGGGSSLGSVAYPLAIIAAANMARDAWGAPNKKWREEGKTGTEKFFDDPGMGLGANVADVLFGGDSELARIPNQVGENFARFAGNPISKAFKADFSGAAKELANAPSDTLQSFGVDKGTSDAVNANLNAPGYVYSEADKGNWDPLKNYVGAPDPLTANISTGLKESGLGDVGDVASAIINPVGWASSRCIIVTACTSPESEEVNITREYRDKYLTPEQLRGYYMIAQKVVPAIAGSAAVKWFVKRFLVDNLIAYGRHALGKGPRPGLSSTLITRGFLALCNAVGSRKPSFVRVNGEIV
jgi:hypothetical protein